MPSLLKLLRKRPVSESLQEIAIFINRELLPFLEEFRGGVNETEEGADTDLTELKNQPFVTSAASSVLTNEKVATDSTEIDVSATASTITWVLNTASVVLGKLQHIGDKRVLGNDSGSSASPTEITVHQELDWIGGGVQWNFDGVDDRIDFGDVLSKERTDTFAISCWFRGNFIVCKSATTADQRGYLFFAIAGTVGIRLNNNIAAGGASTLTMNSSSTITTGDIHHALWVNSGSGDSASQTVYIDGVAIAMVADASALTATSVGTAHLCIGSKEDGSSAQSGWMFHASIWNSALSSAVALELYNSGVPPDLLTVSSAANLQWWVKLDDGDTIGANGVLDHSGNNRNGTAAGGLTPTSALGSLPVRGSSLWELLAPGTVDFPLVSNGTAALPAYERLSAAGFRQSIANSIVGNATASTANAADISIGTNTVLGRAAGNIVAAAIVNAQVDAAAAVAISKLANGAANTITGNWTAGSAAHTDNAVGTNTVIGRVAGNIVAASLVDAQVSASAAIQLSKLATQAAETFNGNFTAGVAVPTALAGSTVAGAGLTYTTGGILAVGAGTGITVNANDVAVTIPLTDGDKGDITVSSSGTVFTVDPATITPAKLAVVASNIAATFTIRVTCTAGTPGSADDVTIYSSNAPFAFRIIDVTWLDSTAIALSSVQLFSATGGGGTALSSVLTAAITGTARNNDTATHTVAANSSVFLRRSDQGVAGEIIILCVPV